MHGRFALEAPAMIGSREPLARNREHRPTVGAWDRRQLAFRFGAGVRVGGVIGKVIS